MPDKNQCSAVIPDSFSPLESLAKYTQYGNIKSYAKGSTIIMPGEEAESIILILEGKIRVSLVTEDGSDRLLYYAGKNSIVGRLFPTLNHIHVAAMEDTRICKISKENLAEIFRLDENVIFDILKNYLTKVAYYMRQAVEINHYNPTIRILRLIYELGMAQGEKIDGYYQVKVSLSQKSISEITGAHYVTVSRVLGCLRKEKIVSKKRDRIIIYDMEKLKERLSQSSYY